MISSIAVGAAFTLAQCAGALAQTPARPPAAPAAGEIVVRLKGNPAAADWAKRCGNNVRTGTELCHTMREFVTDQGQSVLAIVFEDARGGAVTSMRLVLPLGLMLRPGVRLARSGSFVTWPSGPSKGKPVTAEFVVCMPDRCVAEVAMSPDLLRSIKEAAALSLVAMNQAGRTLTFDIPFDGFAKVLDGPPIDPRTAEDEAAAAKAESERQATALRRRLLEKREGQPPAEAPKP